MSATWNERLERWSDRVNPILLRELKQSTKGRVFMLAVLLALVAVVFVAASVAAHVQRGGSGKVAFDAGLATLVPLLLFIVPMQASYSMTAELRSGMLDQLQLTELRPLRIVLGKLGAAVVQFVIYVSLAAPLLMTGFVLRGVDMAMIAVSLIFALLCCVGATAVALAAALQGAARMLRPVSTLGSALGLGVMATITSVYVGTGEFARDVGSLLGTPELWLVLGSVSLGAMVAITLLTLIAQARLSHAFENRSTGFRVFLLLQPPLWFGWIWLLERGAPSRDLITTCSFFLALLGAIFTVFMVTELRRLSPRHVAHVPRRAWLSWLAVPLLPGRDRALLCLYLYWALLFALVEWLIDPAVMKPGFLAFDLWFYQAAVMVCGYALVYGMLVHLLRSRCPELGEMTAGARVLAPLLLVLGCLLPVLFDGLNATGVADWHLGHILNPFWSVDEFAHADQLHQVRRTVVVVALATACLRCVPLLRGVKETLAASRARRAGSHG